MKSVLLNEQGYTTDGKWRLVVVDPKPEMSAKGLCVSEAEHDPAGVYRAMIAASPSPVLAEAVPVGYFQKHPVTGVWEETVGDGVLLYAVPPAPVMPALPAGWKLWKDGNVVCIQSITGDTAAFGYKYDSVRESVVEIFLNDLLKAVPPAPAVPAVVAERLEGASIQARLSADANVLLEDGYSMRAANIKEAIERIAELEARNKELQADAERYRALRDNPHGISIACEHNGNIGASVFVNGAELDAAIDAAKGVNRG